MPKSKPANGTKHRHNDDFLPLDAANGRPAKKMRILDDDDDDEDSDIQVDVSLNVNEEYARRFEYNKKREEKQRLEDKYGKSITANDEASETDSEDGVSEDDAGELATEALDDEIAATLKAIRSKDPRVYDPSSTFYKPMDTEDGDASRKDKKEKAVTLKDYHTQNLLDGKLDIEEEDEPQPISYNQELAEAKKQLLSMAQDEDEEDDEDEFIVAKPKSKSSTKSRTKITEKDVEEAENDPDNFLSNFLAARAWVPTSDTKWKPLESDNESDEERADAYEDEYNMYFEDPNDQNSTLMTYARDAVASTTVRREESNSRKKARDAARKKREAEKREKEEDLARLRKLKVEEIEQKVKQIRKIGGFTGKDFNVEEWTDVLEGDWSDDQWDAEMRKRFGQSYYEDNEEEPASDDDAESKKSKKPKKPKFDDDIDIKDLIPDFDEEETGKVNFTFSSDEEDAEADAPQSDISDSEEQQKRSSKSSKQHKQDRATAKSAARRDRRLIETLVDSSLQYEKTLAGNPKAPTRFRYRDTSPTTFGLTSRDILLASDSQLNEFAGLKKLASFRDPGKKKKDKKHLSKKARLRQWRQDTFGDAEGPTGGFETLIGEAADDDVEMQETGGVDIREGDGKKRKRRSKKQKGVGA